MSKKFINAQPFDHIKIENFLSDEYAELLHDNFPTNYDNWHKYWNPIEVKYANDDIENMKKNIRNLFYILSSDQITNIFSELSKIDNLENDPYLNGAGLHAHPKFGRLNMHLDYEKHPL